jgi:DNA-binding CsgD family transcriptional regulator
MSEAATWAGDWSDARRDAELAHAIALQTSQEPIRGHVLYARALIEAHLGLVEEARATGSAGLAVSERAGSVVGMMLNQAVLGFIELSREDPAAADRHLGPLVAWREVVGIRDPGVVRFIPDEIEALIGLGNLDRAEALLAEYESDASRLARPWAVLAAARCRALLTAAQGDVEGAAAHLLAALDRDADHSQPFERARAVLALGTIQRRTRRRKVARLSLEAALEVFDRLGATLWSARARALLGRPHAPSRDALSALTPGERRVAELVASGRTNREVADQLFVTVRGVEVHLTNTYRKLGIRSRTELAARVGSAPATERAPD